VPYSCLFPIRTSTNRPSTLSTNASKSKQTCANESIVYVDAAYIPYHGNDKYVDQEFFRRIRARYYILNAVEIHRRTLEALIDGKQQWDNNVQVA
jgi:microtubule-associated protein 1